MFAYLKSHAKSETVFDPSWLEFDKALFPKKDGGYSIYAQAASDSQEELPTDMPKPRGKGMDTRVYVESDHAGDIVTRRSRTGFVIFLNGAPIYWNSKKKTSRKKVLLVVNSVIWSKPQSMSRVFPTSWEWW